MLARSSQEPPSTGGETTDKGYHPCVYTPSVPWDFTWMEQLSRAATVPGDLCSLFGGHEESALALAP